MNREWKWVNQFQPQTLVIATILCYIHAVFGLLGALGGGSWPLLIALGLGVGGFGIANEKKWGYTVAVTAAILQVMLWIVLLGADVLSSGAIISFLFDVALMALLIHPMSRDYQRIWFK